jgi:iron complex outermembrane receptor protein
MRPKHPPVLNPLLAVLLLACLETRPGATHERLDLTDFSIEELLEIRITSVSKREELLFDAAAAVYVISAEDIRRSGLRSLPELMRMVPGMQVAQVDANKWAITARGFADRFANKLLVLIDGRSVYTRLFSGVYWEAQDLLIEDIERIEVIRGPGATLWGANAVNGVINIITRSSARTQGLFLQAGAGLEERGFTDLRYGGTLGKDLSYRVYAKYFNRDSYSDPSAQRVEDDWSALRGGFRAEWSASDTDSVTVQGDLYDGQASQTLAVPILTPPYSRLLDGGFDFSGGNLLARWRHRFSEASEVTVQAYYDRLQRRDEPLDQRIEALDVELQHSWVLSRRHQLVWGLGYRRTSDELESFSRVYFEPDHRADDLLNAFFQDQIALVEDRLFLTVGSKFEHNDYSGFEVQPGLRLHWKAGEQQTFWAAAARAVRTPQRTESDARVDVQAFPMEGGPLSMIVFQGNHGVQAEELLAWELGWRVQASDELSLDAAAFYNDYDRLASRELGQPYFEPDPTTPHVVVPILVGNTLNAESYGLELALSWNPIDRWRLRASYSFLELRVHKDASSLDPDPERFEGEHPHHQAQLHSQLNLPGRLELDAAAYYVGPLAGRDISAYLRADLRLGWRPNDSLSLSAAAQNLFGDHLEWGATPGAGDFPTEVQRGGYVAVTWHRH